MGREPVDGRPHEVQQRHPLIDVAIGRGVATLSLTG